MDGDSVDIVHVYANAPSYEWVSAQESGPEGIACVDDAARAAVVYLRHYELTKSPESLFRAKSLLKFVTKMETPDGSFYNFIMEGDSINKEGATSFASFGWWAARGVWSMAAGARVLEGVDSAFAAELRQRIVLTFPHIDSLMMSYGQMQTTGGYRAPRWLLYESGADVSSELLLGLIDYYAATKDERAKKYIERLSDGLRAMQDGNIAKYPYAVHRSWRTTWHMWGNGQTQALASAGILLHDKKMLESAEREAIGFYSRLLILGYKKEMDLADRSKTETYDQIAYGVRPMAVGLLRLYVATHKQLYLKMAALSASWLFGNNASRTVMYDSATGRCFDGIRDSASVNKNSGAESTIEALHTLVELGLYPEVDKYLYYKKVRWEETHRWLAALFRGGSEELTLAIDFSTGGLHLFEGNESSEFWLNLHR
jgi:uncharacterized protein YyaL (SSP411 family)